MLNKVTIIGHLGQEPELKSTPSGASVCNLSIATSEGYKDQNGEWQDKTEWHRVVLWNKIAETASNYLRKGSKVFIEGKLQTKSWEQDGITKYMTEIKGSKLIMLDSKNDASSNDKPAPYIKPEDPPRSRRDEYAREQIEQVSDEVDVPF